MSSPWQAIRQVEHLVQTAAWTDSPADEVVGTSTYIAANIAEDMQLPGRLPFAFLNLGDWREDDDDPLLGEQDIYLVLATAVGGGAYGGESLVGGAGRATGTSDGRGILEIQTPVLTQLENMIGVDGNVVRIAPGSAGGGEWRDGVQLAWRQFVLTVMCSVKNEYPPPSALVATGGAGQIALTWTVAPSRFDLDAMIYRYASGATAPATFDAGDGGEVLAATATSATPTGLVAGTYSVAVFARYDDVNTSDYHYSPQETGTTRLSVSVT